MVTLTVPLSRAWRSSPPRSRPRQKYPAKVQGPNEVHGQSTRPRRSTRTRKRHKNLPLSSTKRHMRRDRHADDRWPRMHQASASRRDANERRTTNRQQAEEVTRQHNHDRGRRAELCRAQPSAKMQLMPHDVAPFIVPQRISSAAPGGSWPRACGDHLER